MIQRGSALILASFLVPATVLGAFIDSPGTPPAPSAARNADVEVRNSVPVTRADPTAASDPASAPGTGPTAAPAAPGGCPDGSILVEGEYCTDVRHTCKRWLDDQKLQYARCAEYEPQARCVGKKVSMRYCIDRFETREDGSNLPLNHQSFVKASKVCRDAGKRICTESEWNFACEGPEMRPYPYGWERRPVCNQDRDDLFEENPRKRVLRDHREPVDARPECASPFGVENMVGNVDETTFRDGATHAHPFRNALKGGWWMAGRNRCRPATTAHDDYYEDIQVGVRCCADTEGSGLAGASG